MRTLAIGDIHGCRRSLEAMADYAGFAGDDTIVTLGDYVDRGPDSRGVIEFLLELRKTSKLMHLRGNHEIMMTEAKAGRKALLFWVGVGGRATLNSYGGSGLDDVPDSHWQFFDECVAFFENDTHFFVHANAVPDVPLEDQPDHVRYWEPFGSPAPHQNGKTMVCGHTSQKSGVPINVGHAICIDTWACGGGWLTCLDTGSGVYWQTSEAGERQSGQISSLLS